MPSLPELGARHRRAVEVIGRALEGGRLHHAYLVAAADLGDARVFAEAVAARLVCASPRGLSACGACPSCRRFASGNHPDVMRLAPNDKDVIPIDAVRDATSRLMLKATDSAVKLVLVDGAERMNAAAQNALLKTLEEPAGATCFLICTARPKALLPTIRSRCQGLRLGTSSREEAAGALGEGGVEAAIVPLLASLAGANIERARAMVELGAEAVVGELTRALGSERSIDVVGAAAELGAERDKADLAIAVLEVMLHDALAAAHGVSDDALVSTAARGLRRADVARAAARIVELRRLSANNLNRTLALESVLLTAKGWLPREGQA